MTFNKSVCFKAFINSLVHISAFIYWNYLKPVSKGPPALSPVDLPVPDRQQIDYQ